MDPDQVRQAQSRIEREYLEMPGLSLAQPQARKLLGLPRDLGEAALKGLARHDFLVETPHGTFLRRSLAPAALDVVPRVVHPVAG
jgi:hypothetical protein